MSVKVLLADSQPLFRLGLKTMLADAKSFQVVGECGTIAGTIQQTKEFSPDVLLIDASIKGVHAEKSILEILDASPTTRIIAHATRADADYMEEMVAAGAAGFVLNQGEPGVFLSAIHAAMAGNIYFCPMASGILAAAMVSRRKKMPKAIRDAMFKPELTGQQRKILRMYCDGKKTREIATALGISVKTVANHRQAMLKRWGCHSIHELISQARHAL